MPPPSREGTDTSAISVHITNYMKFAAANANNFAED